MVDCKSSSKKGAARKLNTPGESDISQSPPQVKGITRSPWWWIPSLYFGEGIPYILVMVVSVVMYAKFNVSNKNIALFTSLLNLPWVIKPLWGPLVDLYYTKRRWIIVMQMLLAVTFGLVALSLNFRWWWVGSLSFFAMAAFLSATHDIAADGFYMLGLDEHRQALFVGVRSMFYRFAMITGQGILIIVVGLIEAKTGPPPTSIIALAAGDTAKAPVSSKTKFVKVEPQTFAIAPGTSVTLAVTLSEAPQTTRVITLSQKYSHVIYNFFPIGEESLVKISSSNRLEFSPADYNVPQKLVIEADPKVSKPVTAVFEARAGNIRASWTACFAGMAILLLLLSLFHLVVLPRPVTDTSTAANRPAFSYAASWMLITVFIPAWALIVSFYGFRSQATWLLGKLGITSADAIGSASAAVPGAGLKSFLTNYSTGDILGFVLTLVFTGIIIGAARSLGRQARADSHYSTASKNGSGVSATIAMVLLAIGLFFGLNPLIVAIAHVYAPKLGSDLLTFTTDILIVFFAWLIYVPRRVRAQSLCAFLGASEKSGIPFAEVFISFFRKPGIGRMIAFLLLYRLGEAMLVKITGPFLIKDRNTGALGLTTVDYGIAYGTIGVLMLIIGGILGGLVAARYGLKRVMFWMCLAINVPDMAYVYLAWAHPHSLVTVEFCVAIESFGYGFGFAAYMLYQLYIAGDGEHKTSHFAICTGLMALGMTLPGMISGALQEHLGYTNFFIAVCVATLPGFVTLAFIPLDPEFGKNKHTS